jgi:septal ring factor EnvC (AmiA/AmiB activator)
MAKLTQMHQLFVIYLENKDSIGYFLKLVRLGKKEGVTPEQIINLLKMADCTKDLNEKFLCLQGEVTDMELKKSVIKEQLEDLEYKISSAEEQLSETDKAYKLKFDELSGICYRIRMLEFQIERFKNSKDYQGIEKIAKDKVNELLTGNRKVLERVLVSVTEALRNEPDRYLLINKKPYNSLGSIQSILYEGDYQFAKEKVLELADKIFYKLQKGLVNSTLAAALGLENEQSKEIVEAEAGDIAP